MPEHLFLLNGKKYKSTISRQHPYTMIIHIYYPVWYSLSCVSETKHKVPCSYTRI
jgi:hypothetical protein